MSEKLQDNLDIVDIMDALEEMSVETKDDDIKNEIDMKDLNRMNENPESDSSKSSRELKSILALSKEANLDTNIVHKRKSTELLCKSTDKSAEVGCKALYTTENDAQIQSRHIIRVDYSKPEVDASEIQQETKDGSNTKPYISQQEDLINITDSALCEGTVSDTNEKTTNVVIYINNKRKDPFCWRCHHEKPTFYCETCPRSFHQKCLKHNMNGTQPDRWICPVCVGILKSENLKERSPAMRGMSLEHFCGLLKFALKRMMQVEGHEPFINPVNEVDFPEYKKYVAQPQDLTALEKNIKSNIYGSPQAFEADALWILHNSIIFNSNQSKFTSIAKSMMKICKHEMSEIENCATCYLNANTKKKTWFVEVCPKPHLVVWAKLKGFPYWPAKAMRINSLAMVDVRFFGAHDRAWVPCKDCFLYCLQDPNSTKHKRNDINESIKELNVYIENLKRIYGEFRYAPYRVVLDPEEELKQLRMLLPKYDPEMKIKSGRGFRKSLHRNGNCSPDFDCSEKDSEECNFEMEEDVAEEGEHNFPSDGSNCDNISDESSNAGSLPGHDSDVHISGSIKVHANTSPGRKRLSCEDLDDHPPKLSRHNSHENIINHCDSEKLEVCTDINNIEESNHTKEDDCPKLIDETKTQTGTKKSAGSDLLLKNITDLIDEPQKENVVLPHDPLVESIKSKIDAIFDKSLESLVSTNNDKGESKTDSVLPHSPTKSENSTNNIVSVNKTKDAVGTVEVIEVNITETSEFSEPMELGTSVNIEDIVQASDISTVSISSVEPEIATVPNVNNIQQLEEDDLPQSTFTDNTELLDQNLTSCSSTDEYTNPLDFVEVTENIPSDDKDASEEEMSVPEKAKDISDVLSEAIAQPKATAALQSNKRRRSSNSDLASSFTVDETSRQKKSLRLVNIDEIRNKVLDNASAHSDIISEVQSPSQAENDLNTSTSSAAPIQSLQSLLEKHLLSSSKSTEDPETVIIKSEPNSEDEQTDAEYMELKRKYLSALNISEKVPLPPKKPISMRTRSKSEENKVKLISNVSKVIDEVSTGVAVTNGNGEVAKNTPKRKEIFIKPLSKMQTPKQKARKSFPLPLRNVYPAQKKEVRIAKSITPSTNVNSVRTPPAIKPNEVFTSSNNIMYIAHPASVSNPVTLLPPNQPITYSANRGNPILTMVQHPANYLPLATPTSKTASEIFESQNYIPLCGEVMRPRVTGYSRLNPVISVSDSNLTTSATTHVTSSTVTASTATSNSVLGTSSVTSDVLDGLGTLTSLIPDTLNKTISDIMCRAPPKLKRRPPGPLSAHFDEGLPSSAGTITSRVNSISHRLGDYFRGMLIELLHEMSATDNPEAEITKLKLENEDLKHKHNEEIIEIKKNVSTILKDVQKSIEDERTRIVEETRSACETECVKRVEEAKSKQWCANCTKEAQFYCCWNTSYCDFPCQEKHWSKHMSKCTQTIQNSRTLQPNTTSSTIASSTASTRPTQPLLLRPTAPPKGFTTKALIAKPTKVIVNRPMGAKTPYSYVKTASGSHITLVESTPGNYELVGNGGPISVGGKFITGLGKIRNNVISVASPSSGPSTSTGISGNTQKAVFLPQTKSLQPTTTTLISDDED